LVMGVRRVVNPTWWAGVKPAVSGSRRVRSPGELLVRRAATAPGTRKGHNKLLTAGAQVCIVPSPSPSSAELQCRRLGYGDRRSGWRKKGVDRRGGFW